MTPQTSNSLRLLCAASAVLLAGAAENAGARSQEVAFRDGNRTWTYQRQSIHGWTIYIHDSLLKDRQLVEDLRAELAKSFSHIKRVVPAPALRFPGTIPIWASREENYSLRQGEDGAVPCHTSKRWLREHGLNPHMAPGVHVVNPRAVQYQHKMFEWAPLTILHELAHAYHHVELSPAHPPIAHAYQHAMGEGLYLAVPDRGNPAKSVEAYAATNAEEYFAELTEAYFGRNDWFPTTRAALEEYDPTGYAMVERAWRVSSPQAIEP